MAEHDLAKGVNTLVIDKQYYNTLDIEGLKKAAIIWKNRHKTRPEKCRNTVKTRPKSVFFLGGMRVKIRTCPYIGTGLLLL